MSGRHSKPPTLIRSDAIVTIRHDDNNDLVIIICGTGEEVGKGSDDKPVAPRSLVERRDFSSTEKTCETESKIRTYT